MKQEEKNNLEKENETYRKVISEFNIMTHKKELNQMLESIKPIDKKILNKYSNVIYKSIYNYKIQYITKFNNDIMKEYIQELNKKINLNIFIESVFKNIDFDNIRINPDGSIQYEDKKIEIEEKNVNVALQALEQIKNNADEIKKKVTYKNPLIIIVMLFIIQAVASGFFNKCGETIYELISSTYNIFLNENKFQGGEESKIAFIENFRIVQANELNVREEASSESKLIGKLYLNQCVEVLEKTKYWTKIKYVNEEKGIEICGWVYSRYLLCFNEDMSALIPE